MRASPAPGTRRTGAAAPVEVSLCGQAYVSTPSSSTGSAIDPGTARCTVGSSKKGAAATDAANLEPNSPNAASWAFAEISPKAAASHTTVGKQDLVAVGQAVELGEHPPDVAHQTAHWGLPMRGTQHARVCVDNRLHLRGAHLRGARPEAAIVGQHVVRDRQARAHMHRVVGESMT